MIFKLLPYLLDEIDKLLIDYIYFHLKTLHALSTVKA